MFEIIDVVLVPFLLTLNTFYTTLFSGALIVVFEQVNASMFFSASLFGKDTVNIYLYRSTKNRKPGNSIETF